MKQNISIFQNVFSYPFVLPTPENHGSAFIQYNFEWIYQNLFIHSPDVGHLFSVFGLYKPYCYKYSHTGLCNNTYFIDLLV